MDDGNAGYKHLIIGGTIKGATSSVFDYLSAHPEICGSSIKETFFFTHEYSGDIERDRKRYMRYFTQKANSKVVCEASPNYLGYKENVAPRIKMLLPGAKVLFILRNPIDRLYSYFNFAKGKLELPKFLEFEEYVDLCEKYSLGQITVKESGIAVKHLRALEIGKYSHFLKNYYDIFPENNIKVLWFEQLKIDPFLFMKSICEFVDIQPDFYQDYTYTKSNVTFSGKRRTLHIVALLMNRLLESVLRQRPELKKSLVKMYKWVNQSREGYVPMSDSIRSRLKVYYFSSNTELSNIFPDQDLPDWVRNNV